MHESPGRQGHAIPAAPSGVHTFLQYVSLGQPELAPQAPPTSAIRRQVDETHSSPRRQFDGTHASPSFRPKLQRRSPPSTTSHFAPTAQSPSTRQVICGAGATRSQRSATQRSPSIHAGLPWRVQGSPTPRGAQPAPVRLSQRDTQVPLPHGAEHVSPGPQPAPHAAPSADAKEGLQKATDVPQLCSRNTARHRAAPSGSKGLPSFLQFTGSFRGSLNVRIAAQLASGSAMPHRR